MLYCSYIPNRQAIWQLETRFIIAAHYWLFNSHVVGSHDESAQVQCLCCCSSIFGALLFIFALPVSPPPPLGHGSW